MTAARLPAAVRDLLRAAPDAAGADADLLARFVAARDEAAFGELVRRHGGPVWDVCRAVLGNRADADDAFQAVFLTLARRAARLRKPGSVGAWLHGVAVRVARKARAAAARRQARESAAPPPPPPEPPDPSWAEVRAAVHEALAALPERYREPLVACYLRGLTQDDAAAELGLSHAAVKKRLERGRDRLRAVLTSRGFGPAVVLAVGAAPAAAVPDHLLTAAPRLAAGLGPVPQAVLGLVEGGSSMTLSKLGAVAALVAAVGVTLAAGGAEQPARRPAAENPRAPAAPPKASAKLKENPIADDYAALSGEWAVQLIETAGEPLYDGTSSTEFTPPPKFVFDGRRCRVEGVQVLFVRDFTFTLDPAKQPKGIDVTFTRGPRAGETFVGIYLIRGDEVRMCLRLQGTELGRPKGYVTNSGRTLYTFILRRAVKPPAGDAAAPRRPTRRPRTPSRRSTPS
jgi:RNA polymerase sigma factor (sigma-70 family)